MDWFYRARAVGYRWAIDADVSVEHEGSATYGERRESELPHSMALFHQLHGVPGLDGPHWEPPALDASWVIASRNNAGHLGRCLGSLAANQQHFTGRMEVVLALDGCTDPSAEVARTVNASFTHPLPLRVIEFPEPAGSAAAAKNRALRLARGEITLPMDDDDATLPGRARLLAALEGGAEVAVGNFQVLGVDGSFVERRVGPLTFASLLRSGVQNWGLWATAVRRETWRRYGLLNEQWGSTEDLELWLRWLRDGVRFQHVDLPVHLYLHRPGSLVFTHDTGQVEEEIRVAFRAGRGTPPRGIEAAGNPPIRVSRGASAERVYEPWQRWAELDGLLRLFLRLQPCRILEIGTARGGTLRAWLENAPSGATVVSVDLPWRGEAHEALFRSWVPEGIAFHFLPADSHDPATYQAVRALLPEVDFLFLDGDHRYDGVKQDLEEYGALVRPGGVIALHDIVPPPAGSPIGVSRLWEEIRQGPFRTEAFIDDPAQKGDGIGVVYVQ
jgi:predicted O-methyltransferase YrrM